MRKKFTGKLDGDKVIISDLDNRALLTQRGFGEKHLNYISIDLFEALFLMENDSLSVTDKGKKINFEKLINLVLNKDSKKEFLQKFEVYKDIRSKGYLLKSGLKFGFDFRVYPKGKKISEEHSQFVIDVISEKDKIKPQYLSKSLRMSIGLHTNLILAIVDNDLGISYYEIARNKF